MPDTSHFNPRKLIEGFIHDVREGGRHLHLSKQTLPDAIHRLHDHISDMTPQRKLRNALMAATILIGLSPVVGPAMHIGREEVEAVSALCFAYTDEDGHVRGSLPSGPYGYPLIIYENYPETYSKMLRFDAEKSWENDPEVRKTYSDFEAFFKKEYLPTHKLYDPDSLIAKLADTIPLYERAHDKIVDYFTSALSVQTSNADSIAHAAIGNMLLISKILAENIGARRKRYAADNELDTALNALSDDDALALTETLKDPKKLLEAVASQTPAFANKIVEGVVLLSIAAAITPSVGMGSAFLAELAGETDLAAKIVQWGGLSGHHVNGGGVALGILGVIANTLNSHAVSCVLPLAMTGTVRTFGERLGRRSAKLVVSTSEPATPAMAESVLNEGRWKKGQWAPKLVPARSAPPCYIGVFDTKEVGEKAVKYLKEHDVNISSTGNVGGRFRVVIAPESSDIFHKLIEQIDEPLRNALPIRSRGL